MKKYKRHKGESYRNYLSRISHVADQRLVSLENAKYDIRNTPEFSSAYAYAQKMTNDKTKPRFRRGLKKLTIKEIKERIKQVEEFLKYDTSTIRGVKKVSKKINERYKEKLKNITGDEDLFDIPEDFYQGYLDRQRAIENDFIPYEEELFGKYSSGEKAVMIEYSDTRLLNAQILYDTYGGKKYKRNLDYEKALNEYLKRNEEYLTS